MLWISLAVLLTWIGVGSLLLFRGAAAQGRDYRREVDRRVLAQGELAEVTLRLVPPFAASLAKDHDVVLVLDHSGSMGAGPGSPLREALRAAENFVRRCPPTIHVGVVVFDDQAQVASPLAGGHRRALRALAATGPGGGTAVHEALDRCREALSAGRQGVPKTVILLSDGGSDRALAAAATERLRNEAASPTVICVGFGDGVDADLLIEVAGAPERYLHVSDPETLDTLFGFLASFVSGQMAVAGLVDEGAQAPSPFRLARTGGVDPVAVRPGEATRIVWSVPVMDLDPVALTYGLIAGCPGWHPVASADGTARWRMPDGAAGETRGPRGPRVLVLPERLTWAWPVLNPLFWLIFGRFFCRARAVAEPPGPEVPEALPRPSLPAPLPEPQARPWNAKVKPAMVLGLGHLGAWTLAHLKHRLRDREITAVELLAVDVPHPASRATVRVGETGLEAGERLDLPMDLRPYVESLRGSNQPGPRAWVPWRDWLLDPRPLHTAQGLAGDRRKARLALLLHSDPLETRIRQGVERVLAQDGLVVVVGAAAEAECSGLLGEVAHMCATHRGSVTAILGRSQSDDPSASGLPALAAELERMVALRGDTIPSDRQDPPCQARQLFDRIVVLAPEPGAPAKAAAKACELIWSLLAYPGVQERIPTSEVAAGEALGCEIAIDARPLPVLHLWHWVRERTLATAINGRWLQIDPADGSLRLPAVPTDLAAGYAASFWQPQAFRRAQPLLLLRAQEILAGENPVVALADQLPVDAFYGEQVEFSRKERSRFAAFCEEWCQSVLDQERERGAWGLPALTAAMLRIERDTQTVLTRIEQMSGNDDFRALTSLASALLVDMFRRFSRLRAAAGAWIVRLAGEQVALDATAAAAALPLCLDIEQARQASEAALEPYGTALREVIERCFTEWLAVYGESFLQGLRFEVSGSGADGAAEIRLRCGELLLGAGDDLGASFRGALDRYRGEVLSWRLRQDLAPTRVEHPADWLRVGQASAQTYPQIPEAAHEDDPYLAAALRVQRMPLRRALGVVDRPRGGAPYVWPEETNAERITEKLRNAALREALPFPPAVIQMLRDPLRLYAFVADVAGGNLRSSGEEYLLDRDGRELPVGAVQGTLEPLGRFHDVARRVVTLGRALNGQAIPDSTARWTASPEEILEKLEAHPLVHGFEDRPEWAVWRDVVRGLALEVGTALEGPQQGDLGKGSVR